ncbi:MAG: ABC transporter ATP-binding protein [Gammaproteobacteria bacterium]
MTPLLQVASLSHRYGTQQVLDTVSFTVDSGRVVALLGPSGCGKTTLLRCIAGFEQPDAGTIALAGKTVAGEGRKVPPEAREVGVVFQDLALFPHLSVGRNIAFGLRHLEQAARRERVSELLARVGLGDMSERYPHELSGGQQQRVAIARALAPRPRLLLLDEPFSSLDRALREHLAADVHRLVRELGITAVLVTHDQHEAFAVADEIGVLRGGRIIQWDTPYNLYHRPVDTFVAGFVGQGTLLPATVDDRGLLVTAVGLLPQRDGQIAFMPGSTAQVLLRPDDIVHDDGSPLTATVLARAFRGAEFLYTLELADGTRVLSLIPSHHDHPEGSRIGIRVDFEHIIAFPG